MTHIVQRMKEQETQVVEIDLFLLIKFFRKYFLRIAFIGLFFGITGYLFSYLLPRKYEVTTVLLPENAADRMGSGLNAIFGISGAGSGADAFRPDLYPNILSSYTFADYILNRPYEDATGKRYANLKEYLAENDQPGWFLFSRKSSQEEIARFSDSLKAHNPDILFLSNEEMRYIGVVKSVFAADYQKKSGLVELSAEFEDPVITSQLVNYATKYLFDFIAEYRGKKSVDKISYLQHNLKVAEQKKNDAERRLQAYRDSHRNTYLNVARMEEARLANEYQLAAGLYNQLVAQLEQSRILLLEEKPVFQVLEPAQVPLHTSSPRRLVIAALSAFLAGLLSTGFFLYKHFLGRKS